MAVGTELQYSRLRRDVGASEDLFDNDVAEAYFVEALERYPDDAAKMVAYTRVVALRGIRASSAMLGKYAQNQHMEDFTKVFDNLTVMLREAQAEVDAISTPTVAEASDFAFGVATGRRGR